MSKSSRLVHRSPTPEPEEEHELTLEESIQLKLVQSGTRARLKKLLRERLEECGWCEDVKEHCKDVLRERGSATVDEIVKAVKPKGRASVPDDVKAELLGQLRATIAAT